jgi:pyruvate kinase
MRRAKIVCTLGPASSSYEAIKQLAQGGMDVARLNFSHGDHEDHRKTFNILRQVSAELRQPIAILQDLQGPKIRVGRFPEGPVTLEEGQDFTIVADPSVKGNASEVGTSFITLHQDVTPGQVILIDDGLLRLRVKSIEGLRVNTVVEIGGRLSNNKGMNIPGAPLSVPSLTDKDRVDLEFGVGLGVDYIALSFVRSALDILELRTLLTELTEHPPGIIAKIEKPQALDELDEIIAASDGIMIARGDLGVEMPAEQVPLIQKSAIARANALGRLTITATQMLDSMQTNPRPTRAEASDVANAVLDGTDAVMLSGETASGKYPQASVRMMDRIVREVEQSPIYQPSVQSSAGSRRRTFANATARAAVVAADELDVRAICAFTQSGATALLLSCYRPDREIIALTPSDRVYQRMALYWGVAPFRTELGDHTEDMINQVEQTLRAERYAQTGDEIVIVMGVPVLRHGETNTVNLHRMS